MAEITDRTAGTVGSRLRLNNADSAPIETGQNDDGNRVAVPPLFRRIPVSRDALL